MDEVPAVITIRGRKVTLRPVRAEEFETLAAARVEAPGGPPFDERRLRDRIEHSGRFHAGELLLAIESQPDGRLVGEIQARHPEHALPPGVWELGIELYDHADRGRGLGVEATALLAAHLFQDRGAHRVQATTETANAPMRGVLQRLGFGFEGVLRGFWPNPDGAPLDYVMYGMTRDDFTEKKDENPTTWTSTS